MMVNRTVGRKLKLRLDVNIDGEFADLPSSFYFERDECFMDLDQEGEVCSAGCCSDV